MSFTLENAFSEHNHCFDDGIVVCGDVKLHMRLQTELYGSFYTK